MQRDRYKTTEDFLSDISFRKWILEGADNGWKRWLEGHPGLKPAAEEAKLFLLASGAPVENTSSEEVGQALEETWDRIHQEEEAEKRRGSRFAPWWKYAAAVILLAGIAFWWTQPGRQAESQVYYSRPETSRRLKEIENLSESTLLLTLPDSSSVVLQPGSKLSYPPAFDPAERVVYFSGEGFFEISRNPTRPFLVITKEVITKVLGTSFRIKAYSDRPEVEVSVKTGSVKVAPNRRHGVELKDDITLAPNESIRFDVANLSFGKIQVPLLRTPPAGGEVDIDRYDFSFTDRQVSEIFAVLEKAYAVKIAYPETLKDCHISSPLDDEPLPEKLKIICESIGNGTRFSMEGSDIRIYSNGCN